MNLDDYIKTLEIKQERARLTFVNDSSNGVGSLILFHESVASLRTAKDIRQMLKDNSQKTSNGNYKQNGESLIDDDGTIKDTDKK